MRSASDWVLCLANAVVDVCGRTKRYPGGSQQCPAEPPPAAAKRLGDILRRDIPPGAVVVLHQANDRTKEIELQTYGTVLTSENYVRLFIIILRS